MMETTLHGEFLDAAESYAQTGRAIFDGLQLEARRQRQCPTIFGLPSLTAQPIWPVSTPGCVIDADIVRAISKEYHDYRDKLRQERVEADVNQGEWEVNYLMEEGRWCHSPGSRLVSEYFPVTASVLASFPVFETGLGYVYFSRLGANTEIRPHCGPTNCKLRVQIVLYPKMDDAEGKIQDDELSIGGGDSIGVLEVADQQRVYRSGETIVFDDSFLHSVRTGNQERVVLLIDIWHPTLLNEANQDIRDGIAGVFPIQQEHTSAEWDDHHTMNRTAGDHAVSAVAAVVTTEATWATVTTAVSAVAVTEGDVSETHVVIPHAAISETDAQTITASMNVDSTMTTTVVAAEVVEPTTVATAAVAAEDHHGSGDDVAKTVLKIANQALDEQQRRLQLLDNGNLDPRAIMRAQDVFVSVPEARDDYSNHLQSALYAKQRSINEPNSYDYLFKMLLVGDSGAGKSSFLLRLSENTFTMTYIATIGVDFKIITRGFCDPVCPASVKGAPVTVKMQLWDTAGPERFRTITSSYYRGAMGIFLMFDITDRQSFEHIRTWMEQIQLYGSPEVAILMIGMKNDRSYRDEEEDMRPTGKAGAVGGKEPAVAVAVPAEVVERQDAYGLTQQGFDRYREVSYEEALAMAEEFGIPYMECSAMTGDHTQDALATMVHHIFRKRGDMEFAPAAPNRPAPALSSNKRCVIS